MSMLHYLSLCCVLLMFSVNSQATLNTTMNSVVDFRPVITIDDYGVYQVLNKTHPSFSAQSTAGYDSVVKTELITTTTQIPLEKGLVFGFNYTISYLIPLYKK